VSVVQQQGQRAGRNGRFAEHVIADTLTRRAIPFHRQWRIGKSIFGTDLIADFYIPHMPAIAGELVIESKWQQVGGSAEEKLCYLVENIRHSYSCPVMVVIDGGGFRSGAIQWIRAQVDGSQLIAVFSIVEFLTWCNQTG
jgi:hypothetical protein